jgi:murein L,D-transpeptidase YcbB/YkuD
MCCLALAALLLTGGHARAELRDERPTLPTPSAVAPAVDPALVAAIRGLLSGDSILQQVYADRGYAPIWVTGAGLEERGERLLSVLERLQRNGAVASEDIAPAVQRRGATAPTGLAALELLLSAAVVELAVDPEDLLAPGPHPQALSELADGGIDAELQAWLPADPTFWRLRAAVADYQALADRGGWPVVNPGPKLEPGMRDGRVPQVRQRLRASGDLTDEAEDPLLYDDALAEAVRQFQARHGLAVDAVIGHATIDAFNVPVGTRLQSMIFNLNRLYAQARDWGDDYVMVNIAGPQLTLVQDGEITAFYNVIVGRRDRRTPEIHSAINRLEFNPYWNVPAGIYVKDFLPKLRDDSSYLSKYKNIRVLRAEEPNEVDPATIDWFSEEARQMRLRLRQDPGPENALGPAKFLFPNSFDVYLHGTNKPSLFAKADRFLSSGCVRLPDPLGFAALLLKDDPNWTRARIEETVQGARNRSVTLAAPLPVHLIYDTAWVDEAGTVQFRQDVYGRDKQEARVADRGGRKS